MNFKFLQHFRGLFDGKRYLHRISTHGDYVSQFVFEDLLDLAHSPTLVSRVREYRSVLNAANKARGVKHRRGDGSFGTLIPGETAIVDPGFTVGRGQIANVELGIEVYKHRTLPLRLGKRAGNTTRLWRIPGSPVPELSAAVLIIPNLP